LKGKLEGSQIRVVHDVAAATGDVEPGVGVINAEPGSPAESARAVID
jgi:hypothetical protein